jgi:hypothetical protein
MTTLKLTTDEITTTVNIVKETDKAILVEGNASEAWFPKSAIDENGNIANWFKFTLSHIFLFEAPYNK